MSLLLFHPICAVWLIILFVSRTLKYSLICRCFFSSKEITFLRKENRNCQFVLERDNTWDSWSPWVKPLYSYLSWPWIENKAGQKLLVVTAKKKRGKLHTIHTRHSVFSNISIDHPLGQIPMMILQLIHFLAASAQSLWSWARAGPYAEKKQHTEKPFGRQGRDCGGRQSRTEHSRSPGHDNHTQAQLETIKPSYSSFVPLSLHLLSFIVASSLCLHAPCSLTRMTTFCLTSLSPSLLTHHLPFVCVYQTVL